MARDPWLDNAKMLLVTLVVVGHAILLAPSGDGPRSRTYDFLYVFHVPAFVLISGYLSRSFQWSRRHLTALVTTLVIPYLVFEGLIAAFRIHVGGEQGIERLWLDPHWPMWYLAVLIQWRLLTPLLRRHWVAVPIAIAVSLGSGLVEVEVFDVNRALGLLVFFVIGLHTTPEHLADLKRRGAWLAGVVLLLGLFLITSRIDAWISTEWLYYRTGYDDLGAPVDEGMASRGGVLLAGLAGTIAVLTLVPRGGSWFSTMGRYTMVVYLMHGFAIKGVAYTDYNEWVDHQGLSLLLLVVGAVALSLLLAWPPVSTRLVWLVDPVNTWKRHRASGEPTPTQPSQPTQPG